jgi:hypothetical protein
MKHDISDLLFIAGGLVLGGGFWMIYRPAAVILAGLLLMAAGYAVHLAMRK